MLHILHASRRSSKDIQHDLIFDQETSEVEFLVPFPNFYQFLSSNNYPFSTDIKAKLFFLEFPV